MTVHMPISTSTQPLKLNAHAYWLLADAGAFSEFAKAELIEGEILVVNAVHSRHARAHASLTFELGMALREAKSPLILLSTPSTELSDDSIPEPDIAIATNADGKAVQGADVVLAVEVSDTTLATDMGRKMRLYARHGVPEYWVADVEAQVIHQFWTPGAEGYGDRKTSAFGETMMAISISGLAVATESLIFPN
jgi:Uma2 family endonuclease